MYKLQLRSVIVLLVSLGLSAGYAFAERHDRGHERHEMKREAWRHHEAARDRESHREVRRHDWERERHMRAQRERFEHERRARFERERRERWEREHRADRRPPGWDHGKKVGWGDHNVPPGQASTSKGTPWQRGTSPSPQPATVQTASTTQQTNHPAWPFGAKAKQQQEKH